MDRKPGKSNEQQACYFITFNVVEWVDIFVRPSYKYAITDALNEAISSQSLVIYAWCLMSNHLHLVAQVRQGHSFAVVIRQLKKQMARRIMEVMEDEPDPRRSWMLARFENFSQCLKRLDKHPLWQDCNHPVHIETGNRASLLDHIRYIHENPVRDRIVDSPEDYLFSSARDYSGMKGLVNIRKIIQMPGDPQPNLTQKIGQRENMN
ncbi:MAG: transposase [Bacteroidetes bacterium]|nr:transposase [Bacteroidota bacterium]